MTSFGSVPYLKKGKSNAPEKREEDKITITQMDRILTSTVKGMIRSIDERDFAGLAQAGNNSHIVEEVFLQSHDEILNKDRERTILELSRNLKTISSLIVEAKTEDPIFQNTLERLKPYFSLILEDICPSKRVLNFEIAKTPSKKQLPSLKDDLISVMSNSSSRSTIKAGINLYQVVDLINTALELSYHLLSF